MMRGMLPNFQDRAIQPAEVNNPGFEKAEDNLAFWRPFTLRFYDAETERKFQASCIHWNVMLDSCSHSTGTIFAYILLIPWRHLVSWKFTLFWLFVSMVWAPLNLYLSLRKRAWYERRRKFFVVVVKWLIHPGMVPLSKYLNCPKPHFADIILHIVSKSPALSLFFSSMLLRLEFRDFVWVNVVSLAEAFLWIPAFCDKCAATPEVTSKMQQLGLVFDTFLSQSWGTPISEDQYYPCWMVTSFIITFFAFVLPTFVVFATELSARVMFLKPRVEPMYQESIDSFADNALRVGMLAFSTASVGVWCLLYFVLGISNALVNN